MASFIDVRRIQVRKILQGVNPGSIPVEQPTKFEFVLNMRTAWAAQTALRDVIGKTVLSDMLEGREKISTELQKIIDERTEPWGINVISVEVKDVLISARSRGCHVDAGASRT